MKSFTVFLSLFTTTLLAAEPLSIQENDWPWWRGPTRDGKAAKGQTPPTTWSESKNVIWKCDLPGRGHGSPTLMGSSVYLTTADGTAQTQGVVAIDRASGKLLWEKTVNTGGFPKTIHPKNTHASGTISVDGTRIFASFYNHDAIQVVALDTAGTVLWNESVGPFIPMKYEFGYACSPILYRDTVIVSGDWEKAGFIAALDRRTGKQTYRIQRSPDLSFSTPVIANISGKDQMLISGGQKIMAYDPANGDVLWSADAGPTASCGTLVWDGDIVFASGGYPQRMVVAVQAGTGKVLWQNNQKCYEQSMLTHNGYLYAHTDTGVTYCWRASDGQEMWSQRMSGPVSASPVLVGDIIYATDERGNTWLFKASPKAYEEVATNELGNHSFATPAFVDNRIYTRVGYRKGDTVQEVLYCLGE